MKQIANALIKSKKHPEFTMRYKGIKARRGHKKAIILSYDPDRYLAHTFRFKAIYTRWFS